MNPGLNFVNLQYDVIQPLVTTVSVSVSAQLIGTIYLSNHDINILLALQLI